MQDSNFSQNRLDDLLETIGEAKRSLNNWQDKRTEALIRLDSFSYDIQQIGEEKKRSADTISELKNEISGQAKIYAGHVSELTDQMQLLKLENEQLRNEVLDKTLNIEAIHKETDNQRTLRETQARTNQEKLTELRRELETKAKKELEDLMHDAKVQIEFLNAKLVEVTRLKADVDGRAERAESELNQIRANMLNVLEANAKHAQPVERERPRLEPVPRGEDGRVVQTKKIEPGLPTTPATEISMQEVRKLRPIEVEFDNVDDYLKRLGY